jgi:ABC-type antimicrobial peptide transport system permease subunit
MAGRGIWWCRRRAGSRARQPIAAPSGAVGRYLDGILSPHVVLLPGFAIFVIVLALNLVGDAPRDLLHPRTYSH